MVELIILVVVVVVIGFMKGLRPEDRGTLIRSVAKLFAQAVAYVFHTGKVGTKLAYTTGNNMGLATELEMAEQLKVVSDWEKANVAPVKDGVMASEKHLQEFGVTDALNAAKAKNTELKAEMAKLKDMV